MAANITAPPTTAGSTYGCNKPGFTTSLYYTLNPVFLEISLHEPLPPFRTRVFYIAYVLGKSNLFGRLSFTEIVRCKLMYLIGRTAIKFGIISPLNDVGGVPNQSDRRCSDNLHASTNSLTTSTFF